MAALKLVVGWSDEGDSVSMDVLVAIREKRGRSLCESSISLSLVKLASHSQQLRWAKS
jgi:hypothetical protein